MLVKAGMVSSRDRNPAFSPFSLPVYTRWAKSRHVPGYSRAHSQVARHPTPWRRMLSNAGLESRSRGRNKRHAVTAQNWDRYRGAAENRYPCRDENAAHRGCRLRGCPWCAYAPAGSMRRNRSLSKLSETI